MENRGRDGEGGGGTQGVRHGVFTGVACAEGDGRADAVGGGMARGGGAHRPRYSTTGPPGSTAAS